MSGNLIISQASAGSGKTFKLVKTFLQLAFDVSKEEELKYRFKQILAITFTNKATSEMKSRILTYLQEIKDNAANSQMAKSIIADAGNSFGVSDAEKFATLQHYASIVHKAILHNYSDLSVCTIDSFVNRIVQTFAHDLDLPLNFEVTLDNDDVTQHIVDNLMENVGNNPNSDLAKMLEEFIDSKMEDGKSTNIENEIKEQCNEIYKETIGEHLSQLANLDYSKAQQINEDLLVANKKDMDYIYSFGDNIYNQCMKISNNPKDYHQGSKGLFGLLQKIHNKETFDKITVNSYCEEFDKKIPFSDTTLIADIRKLFSLINNNRNIINTRNSIRKYIFTVALLKELNDKAQLYYAEEGTLHIGEFNKKVNEAIKDEPAPFIYERIGNRYRNFLIDEFQDTSKMQWQNLLPLVDNSVSGGNDSLIVGDAKQAIYRFRQGDAQQFIDLPNVDSELHGNIFKSCHRFEPLDTNYRTCENIVNFNNHLFEYIANSSSNKIKEIYIGKDPNNPALTQKNIKGGGYVNVSFIKKEDNKDNIPQYIFDTIQQQKELGYSYQDICILARDNKKLTKIGSFLTEKGIPVISNESFLLNNSNTVTAIIAMLRHVANPLDTTIAKQLLVALQNIGKLQNIAKEIISNNNDIASLLKNYANIELHSSYMRGLSLYDCCEEAIRELQLGDNEQHYISAFLNIVASYSQFHKNDITEFLEWYDKKADKLTAKSSSKQDAVELMTVHKSKGLEARIVIYAIYQPKSNSDQLWINLDATQQKELNIEGLQATLLNQSHSKDENTRAKNTTIFDDKFREEDDNVTNDELNVFYVAMTRPKEKLFVVVETTANGTTTEGTPGNYLQTFVTNHSKDVQKYDTDNYHVGDNNRKDTTNNEQQQDNSITLNNISYSGWTNRIVIAPESKKIMDRSSASIDYGNKVHSIMSAIRVASDSEKAVAEYVSAANQKGITEDAEALKQAVQKVVEHPSCKEFFATDAEVKTECDILYNGELRRPDRIVITPSHTYIVDFKTGKPDDKHKQQIAEYCNAIADMGYENIKGYLIYIGETVNVEEV